MLKIFPFFTVLLIEGLSNNNDNNNMVKIFNENKLKINYSKNIISNEFCNRNSNLDVSAAAL